MCLLYFTKQHLWRCIDLVIKVFETFAGNFALHWRIQGGARKKNPLSLLISFFFIQSWVNNRLKHPPLVLGNPLWEILDPPLHCCSTHWQLLQPAQVLCVANFRCTEETFQLHNKVLFGEENQCLSSNGKRGFKDILCGKYWSFPG